MLACMMKEKRYNRYFINLLNVSTVICWLSGYAAAAEFRYKTEHLSREIASIIGYSEIELLEDEDAGLFVKLADGKIGISAAAYNAQSSNRARIALVTMAASYRVESDRDPPKRGLAQRVAEGYLGAMIDGEIEERERLDPNLKMPTQPRVWKRLPVKSKDLDMELITARGVAWAEKSGVCEVEVVNTFWALARNPLLPSLLRDDVKLILKGFGGAQYSPRENC